MKKTVLIIGFLIIAILALSVVKTFVSNRISTSGSTLGAISDKINAKKIENTLLSEKLYSLSSLTNVFSQANSLGFVQEKSNYVLTNPIPIAIKQ
jgi:cell division protein FtsL